MASDRAALEQELKSYLNKVTGPYNGWHDINRSMINNWCDAMGDTNPLYRNDEFAACTPLAQIAAPPTMLQAWTFRNKDGQYGPGSTEQDPFAIMNVFREHGYDSVVGVNYDQRYERYLHDGESVHYSSEIIELSEYKQTALGEGYFVTELMEFMVADGEKVASTEFRYFIYRAPELSAGQKAAVAASSSGNNKVLRPYPVENYDNLFFWQGLRDGELRIQQCSHCDTLRHPPQPVCSHCQSDSWGSITSSGKGTVHSYVIMHHPQIPPFDSPNPIGVIQLEEGARIVGQLIDIKPEDIEIGLAVEVRFIEVQDGLTLAQFAPTL